MGAKARVALCGALAGAVNAWLCYARLPVSVNDNPDFAWHVIPAGAFHGGLLAIAAFSVGIACSTRGLGIRMAVALPLAWISGFISWIPLSRSAMSESWAESLIWPFREGWNAALLNPLWFFGLVALFYYAAVVLYLARERRLITHVVLAIVAGIVGSLRWWIAFGPWYFSVLHGAIWGTFVGIGAWSIRRKNANARAAADTHR